MLIAALIIGAVVALLLFAVSRIGHDDDAVRRLRNNEYRALIKSIWWQ